MSSPLLRVPHPRFLAFLAVFMAVALALWLALPDLPPSVAIVTGFDTGAAVFILSTVPLWREAQIPMIRARAARDDGGRTAQLLVLLVALVAVLVSLGLAVHRPAGHAAIDLAVVVTTLALAWVLVNLIYAFHYANLFYGQWKGTDRGGLAFPGEHPPVFVDFCYFSFVIGMTCQVSDVAITHPVLRRTALVHGLVAFFFNLGVLALTINVLAGVL
jgi:uncharacterized membrane protein